MMSMHTRSDRWFIGGMVLLALVAIFTLVVPSGDAAPTAPPANTAEPSIGGSAEQGRALSASRGSWTGGGLSFAYRWVRCGANGGRPDGSDCTSIAGATGTRYTVASADVGFRLRVRVTATNSEGSHTAASDPTGIVVGPPVNSALPVVSGNPLVDSTLTVSNGSWSGRQPISYAYGWVRCNSAGGECAAIPGATGRNYRLTSSDVNRKVRVNVTARNAVGSTTVLSSESGIVGVPLPPGAIRLPSGAVSIPPSSVPNDQRLIVSQVLFSPNPVASRGGPVTVRVKVTDTRGYLVRDVVVFVRSTPRVTSGSRLLTGTDGWMSAQLVPMKSFPLRKQGHVQFFVKASRSGDPALGGVAGYRLVQVRTAAPAT